MSTSTAPRFNLYWFASPQTFYPLAGRLIPLFVALAVMLTLAGLYIGFLVAPTDATQGESYRIIFIHVPAAWMSMFLYVVMAFWAAVGLAFNTRLSSMMATAIAPTGALMTFPRPVDRGAVGTSDLGRVLGLGCAAHVRTDTAVPVPWFHCIAGCH